MYKKKLLVLTGAGFSQDYLHYDKKRLSSQIINETLADTELFKKYYSEIYNQQPCENILIIQKLYSRIWENLQNKTIYSNELYPPNFETVFYLLNFLCQMQKPDKIIESHHTFYLPNFVASIKEEWKQSFSITDFYYFKNFLLNFVAKFETTNKNLKKINQFIKKLKENYDIKYYTLNYDDLFKKALEYNPDKKYYDILDDFNLGCDINVFSIIPSKVFSNKLDNCYFHLHGSVNFGIGSHTCTFHKDKNKASKERSSYLTKELNTGGVRDWSPFIIGYNKDSIFNNEPYASIHLRMGLDILDADELLIMGYGLNDEHINKWLKYTTPVGQWCQSKVKRIRVVDFKNEQAQKKYYKRFLTIARSSGEIHLPNSYDTLTTQKSKDRPNIFYIKENDFNLEFDFNGIDKFISQYI